MYGVTQYTMTKTTIYTSYKKYINTDCHDESFDNNTVLITFTLYQIHKVYRLSHV